jgi:protein-disulfide isomerase
MRRFLQLLLTACLLVACRPTPPPAPALETPTFGQADSAVEVLAFIDFECPFSRQEGDALRKLPSQAHVRVLYLPLDQHPNSVLAARAAVAADAQHKFTAFWQKWLQPDAKLSRDALIAWSVEAGLDAKQFVAALDSPQALARVARDVAIAHALGITGTPSFLFNGALLQGQQSPEALVANVQREAKETAILQAAGAQTDKLVHARVAQNAPSLLVNYERYVERAEPAPPQPVPMVTQRQATMQAELHPAPLDGHFGGQRALLLPDQATKSDDTLWRVTVRPDDPQIGDATAPVTYVVFFDLTAPDVAAQIPWMIAVATDFPHDFRLVFKHLPRPVHPLSRIVAEALEAAREQGRFAQLLNALLAAPQPLTQRGILGAAAQLDLNASQFNTALAAHSGKARIDDDLQQAAALGITGFGGLYVNGVAARDWHEDAIKPLLQAQGARAQALLQAGTPPAALYEKLIADGRLLDALEAETHTFDLSHAANQGLPGAPVQVVVFGDFQCPYTARLWPHLRKLDEEMPGRLKIAWLDFPQTTVHPLAEALAEAGQEARRQGKFWEFVHAVARHVDLLDDHALSLAAKEAGLKDKPLQEALKKHTWTQDVQAARVQGEKAGVRATPTVFLDGHLFTPTMGLSADTLRPAIRRLLATH